MSTVHKFIERTDSHRDLTKTLLDILSKEGVDEVRLSDFYKRLEKITDAALEVYTPEEANRVADDVAELTMEVVQFSQENQKAATNNGTS